MIENQEIEELLVGITPATAPVIAWQLSQTAGGPQFLADNPAVITKLLEQKRPGVAYLLAFALSETDDGCKLLVAKNGIGAQKLLDQAQSSIATSRAEDMQLLLATTISKTEEGRKALAANRGLTMSLITSGRAVPIIAESLAATNEGCVFLADNEASFPRLCINKYPFDAKDASPFFANGLAKTSKGHEALTKNRSELTKQLFKCNRDSAPAMIEGYASTESQARLLVSTRQPFLIDLIQIRPEIVYTLTISMCGNTEGRKLFENEGFIKKALAGSDSALETAEHFTAGFNESMQGRNLLQANHGALAQTLFAANPYLLDQLKHALPSSPGTLLNLTEATLLVQKAMGSANKSQTTPLGA